MKKFTKACLLTAMILGILGIGCLIVGGILGAHPIRAFREIFKYERYTIDFDKKYDLEDFELAGEYSADSIQSLFIDVDMGSVIIKPVSANACTVWIDKGVYSQSVDVTAQNGDLIIEEHSRYKRWKWFAFSDWTYLLAVDDPETIPTKVIIELPEKDYQKISSNIQFGAMKLYDLEFSEMSVNVDAGAIYSTGTLNGKDAEITINMGSLSIEDLNCEQADISADMGDVNIKSITADTLNVDADMGNVNINSITAGNLTVDADMGSVNLAHTKAESLEANCEMGNIDLELVGIPEDYYISYDVDMGSVDIDRHVKNNKKTARYTVVLNCDMGDIEVSFLKNNE